MKFIFRKKNDGGMKKKPRWKEWIEAAVFAIVAATLIRTFIFEAFVIPSSSMEKTLLVHDYLFVSKISYGPRLPNTPVAWPFMHHTMPFTKNTNAFSTIVKWPYMRLPGFSAVKRNDIIVFNYPCGDSVFKSKEGTDLDYYPKVRGYGYAEAWKQFGKPIVRPVDKRENLIKRCVAVAGDTIQLINGTLFVNGVASVFPPHSMRSFHVRPRGGYPLNDKQLEDLGLEKDAGYLPGEDSADFIYDLTVANVKTLTAAGARIKPDTATFQDPRLFPYDTGSHWTEEKLGPIYIPRKGSTVHLDSLTLPFYKRIIDTYEHNTLRVSDGRIFINGKETTTYTFKMNYYWMMGDNRRQSTDSRFWGYVPEDHIVGKAWLIWLSYGHHGLRWRRLFNAIK
ncbi:MAG TPA: signal peptidase I [Chitinophaga sp.]|uniref:signal peptidase I n=1 Tax=Chitinophaga sp. TaxID=1869181 RepID=UPI002CE35A56|nr:signal peptidase I [Chitinophaga sp.]HVI47649.1 signal peptidase I [Chitinophaga sp.]